MQHHRGVFADRIQHDRFFKLGGHFADDMNALGFELFEVGQLIRVHGRVLRASALPGQFYRFKRERLCGRRQKGFEAST